MCIYLLLRMHMYVSLSISLFLCVCVCVYVCLYTFADICTRTRYYLPNVDPFHERPSLRSHSRALNIDVATVTFFLAFAAIYIYII